MLLGKFIFSSLLCLLEEVAGEPGAAVINTLGQEYTFIGPAPRYLFAGLLGNAASTKCQRPVLGVLRNSQREVAQKFGVRHWLYNLQICPCDFCHFALAVIDKRADFDSVGVRGRRGGLLGKLSCLLLWRRSLPWYNQIFHCGRDT